MRNKKYMNTNVILFKKGVMELDFVDEVKQFAQRIINLKRKLLTEEATKTSLVLPFFQLLGYDVFSPLEFVPEFIADTGTKKGEKVDYAILRDGDPIMIIEVKPCDTDLNIKHINQLYRYFAVTKARFGILTNGIIYQFYSDLEEPNKMDNTPFMKIDLSDLNDKVVNKLKQFRKESFDIRGILGSASELKYAMLIKNSIATQFTDPSDQLIKAIVTKEIYNGVKTQAILDKFRDIIKNAFSEYINDILNEKFRSAISSNIVAQFDNNITSKSLPQDFEAIELEVLDYVKSLSKNPQFITYAKTSKYSYITINGNVRKWICRIYIRQSENLFVLHKFDSTDYENEYFFDDVSQLSQIQDVIQKVLLLCENMK